MPHQLSTSGILQNIHLVWLDENLNEDNEFYRNSITKLKQVINKIDKFTNIDECIDFITNNTKKTIVMIVSEAYIRNTVSTLQDIVQVQSVYIFSDKEILFKELKQQSSKVKGIFTNIELICQALQQVYTYWDPNDVSISFMKSTEEISNENLNRLQCSFMYTQILKEILLTIDFNQDNINQFLKYYAEKLEDNKTGLTDINQIKDQYSRHSALWWYSSIFRLYSVLNKALRLMEVDVIVKMGFFLRDLHNDIAALHKDQFGKSNNSQSQSFTIFRGQGLSEADFNQLKNTQGGLLAFNNFLSTSSDGDVSYLFAESNTSNPGHIGILFEMIIDLSISGTPFANISHVSRFKEENEILFSMHSVFRIGQIIQRDENGRLWQVNLTLTGDNDPQLCKLAECMRKETSSGCKGWLRLGQLLLIMGEFNKAEELYEILLEQSTDQTEKAHLHHQLGFTKDYQGKFEEAIKFYEESIGIKKNPSPTQLDLASFYNNIGCVHFSNGKYKSASEYFEKAVKIFQEIFPPNRPDLATSYHNTGVLYYRMNQCSKALEYYEKALQIIKKTLPSNHPDLATLYNNIGATQVKISNYSEALIHYTQAYEIRKKILPENHVDLASSCNNIGGIYENMGEYSKALEYHANAYEIRKKAFPENHPDLANSCNNIGEIYGNMGQYSQALEYHEKAYKIRKKAFPENHPDLATSCNNIGKIYGNMGQYSKALEYHEKSLEILKKTLPANHPDLATSYHNIGTVYHEMKHYSKALDYYEKALEIKKKTLHENHPDLATSYNCIGVVYNDMKQYPTALEYYEKALEIRQKICPANPLDLATSYNNIGKIYTDMGKYSEALEYHEKSLEILKKTFPANHPDLAASYNNIGMVYYKKQQKGEALMNFHHALNIWQKSLPPDHPNIKTVQETIIVVKITL